MRYYYHAKGTVFFIRYLALAIVKITRSSVIFYHQKIRLLFEPKEPSAEEDLPSSFLPL